MVFNQKNISGAKARELINQELNRLVSLNAASIAPNPQDGTLWLDTSNPTNYELKVASNNQWLSICQINTATAKATGLYSQQAISELLEQKIDKSLLAQPNGVVSCDEAGKVLEVQMPQISKPVEFYESVDEFSPNGMSGKIYVNLSNSKLYFWDDGGYKPLCGGLDSINGKKGDIVLSKIDFEKLKNLDNTDFKDKPLSKADNELLVKYVDKTDLKELENSIELMQRDAITWQGADEFLNLLFNIVGDGIDTLGFRAGSQDQRGNTDIILTTPSKTITKKVFIPLDRYMSP